jgi:hypothetical protein
MMNYDRILNRGGFAMHHTVHGFAAALCLLVATACSGPAGQPGTDTGMLPVDDGGMPPVDGWNPANDSGRPNDAGETACNSHSDCADFDIGFGVRCVMQGGTTVCAARCSDTGWCSSSGGIWCTDALAYHGGSMERVCRPTGDECTPSMMEMRVTPPCDPDTRTGAGSGPTGLEGYVGSGMSWFSPSAGCDTGMGPDAMSRIELYMHCGENAGIDPYRGIYYYDRDGLWYANYQNRATQEWSRMSFEIHPEFGPQCATIELFHAGEDVPYQTFMACR